MSCIEIPEIEKGFIIRDKESRVLVFDFETVSAFRSLGEPHRAH